ncbi:FAD-binding oxidoreductase [Kineobactrum salinum]|uniref:FAD-binding oxidoreductase n=1 Tax=Kineobactrum salinum TaxID=2708301 RepID=A0A6C0U6A2_9GAMM|nr:FAD-binding oxidoreductase [Kineobactrum salinum]QIB67393.1 FAD-binding oxidoreductase [Kineobactrum salinum]
MQSFLEQLRTLVGADAVVEGEALAARASSYWDPAPLRALALVRPRTSAEVSAVLKLCHQHGQSVVTHGGLTGCVDGAVVNERDLVLSLERMTAIEDIDTVGRTATVQAGAVLQTVQDAVAEFGLLFPLDLGARGSCTIGGNVATNAGGISVIRYGMMRELVLGLEAVLADGTVISSLNTMLKNNAGYDLKQLFIGTEGTLGVVTRVVLKLKEAPVSVNTALVALTSFEAVCDLLKSLERTLGGNLSAFEVMWGAYFHAVTEPGWHRPPMSRDHAYYVVLEARGADARADNLQFMTALEQVLEDGMVEDAIIPKSVAERDALWSIREDFEAITAHDPTFLYDVSLPIRHMASYVDEVKSRLQQQWPAGRCYVLGHIGDGNLHLFVSPGEGDRNLHPLADEAVYQPLMPLGGSVSAEHGIGLEKKSWLELSRSTGELALMRLLKRTLDPQTLLNPGKVFDV